MLAALLPFGLPGIVIAVLAIWLYRMQQDLNNEHAERIKDAKAYAALAIELHEKVFSTCERMVDAVHIASDLVHGMSRQPNGRR